MLSPHPVGQNSEAVNSNECVTLLSGPITWTESCHWWAKSKFRASFVCHVTGTQAHIYETETRDVYPWKKRGDHAPLDKDWAFAGFFFCSLTLAQTPNNKANKTQRSITSCPLRELQWQSAKRLKICEMWLWKTNILVWISTLSLRAAISRMLKCETVETTKAKYKRSNHKPPINRYGHFSTGIMLSSPALYFMDFSLVSEILGEKESSFAFRLS